MSSRMKTSYVALFLSIALVVGILLGVWLESFSSEKEQSEVFSDYQKVSATTRKLGGVIGMILNTYVDSVSLEDLEANLLSSLLDNLDPHSLYIDKKEYVTEKEHLSGYFEGLGISLWKKDDTVNIHNVYPDGPSKKVGILNGDQIITINGANIVELGISLDSVVSLLRGRKGSMAKLGIKRYGAPELLQYEVQRDIIYIKSIPYSGMLDTSIGYICIETFTSSTADEVRNAVEKLKGEGMKKLILDLRNNGGGLFGQAIEIADMFLPKGRLIVYTEGLHSPKVECYSTSNSVFENGELVIMLNENSASASEVVAGALQDNDRGVIVGRRSFGKALVQEQIELFDGSALLLTTARYYTPSGRCIQRSYDKGKYEYYVDFLRRVLIDLQSDSIVQEINDTVKYYTREGRVVYGGGGIYPDIVLAHEKDTCLVYYNDIIKSNLIQEYAFDYGIKNREKLLEKYPNPDDFIEGYSITAEMFNDFIQKVDEAGVKRNNKALRFYKEDMKILLKARLAYILYSKETSYRLFLPIDREIQKTIDIIKEK